MKQLCIVFALLLLLAPNVKAADSVVTAGMTPKAGMAAINNEFWSLMDSVRKSWEQIGNRPLVVTGLSAGKFLLYNGTSWVLVDTTTMYAAIRGQIGTKALSESGITAGKIWVYNGSSWVLADSFPSAIRGVGSGKASPMFGGSAQTSGQRSLEDSPLRWYDTFNNGKYDMYLEDNNHYHAIYFIDGDDGDTSFIRKLAGGVRLGPDVEIPGNLYVNQTITATTVDGNASATKLTSGTVPLARLGTDAPASGEFLGWDNTWRTPAGGGGGSSTNYGGIVNPYSVHVRDSTGTTSMWKPGVIVSTVPGANVTAVNESVLVGTADWTRRTDGMLQLTSDQENTGLIFEEVTGGDSAGIGIDASTGDGFLVNQTYGKMAFNKLFVQKKPIALSDEETAIGVKNAARTVHFPMAIKVVGVYAELVTASGGGTAVTVRINEAGTPILSTNITIDNGEYTGGSAMYQGTAATAAVISDANIAAYAALSFDIVQIGSNAKGLKVWIVYIEV